MTDEFDPRDGLTRREALKKGARLGGALIWTVPVVQTIGMSPAMAQTVSEGICCLRVDITSATLIASQGTVENDIEVNFRGSNCGVEPNAARIYDVQLILEASTDGGATWDPDFRVEVDTNSNLDPGEFTPTQTIIINPPPGSYLFRLSGTKKCAADGPALPHDVPATYDFAGPVVVPAP